MLRTLNRFHNAIPICATAVLVGCGGGGGGGGGNTIRFADVSVLNTFSDQSGVMKVTNGDNEIAFVATPLVAEIANDFRNGTSTADSYSSGLTPVRTRTYAVESTGTITVGSEAMNVTVWEDNVGETSIMAGIVPGQLSFGITGGAVAYTNPPSGTHSYVGTHTASRRTSLQMPEVGTFTMSADFDAGRVSYSGSSSSSSITQNNMLLDVSDGSFAGNSGSFSWNGSSYTSTMHGNFAGNNAKGVHGVFWTNGGTGRYIGAFAGRKQ